MEFSPRLKNHGDSFNLPAGWSELRDRLNSSTPFNDVSTADIVGGNSGSPLVNLAGKLVRLLFDGNIQSLTMEFVYSEEQSLAIHVQFSAIKETLLKIYDAESLATKLGR
jgi:hypothetical protein